MKVMVVGPTEVEDDVRQAAGRHLVYNRTPEFSEFIARMQSKLKQVFRTDNDVHLLSCSGTGIMECALVNFLSAGDKVVILSAGVFGDRWFEIGTAYGLDCRVIKTEQGGQFDLDALRDALTPDVKAVFATANETSTGTRCDIESVGRIVKASSAILIVDAISSLSANALETDAWHCDVVAASTHKALAVAPGLSLITFSEKAWRHAAIATLPRYYFDLRRYRKDMARNQTPFTPAISLLFQLDARLDKILAEGLENVIERHRKKSDYLRAALESMNLHTFDISPSNGMVGIRFEPDIDAYQVVMRLRDKFGIQITPSPEPDKHRIARVGLFGNIESGDIDELVSALKHVLAEFSGPGTVRA